MLLGQLPSASPCTNLGASMYMPLCKDSYVAAICEYYNTSLSSLCRRYLSIPCLSLHESWRKNVHGFVNFSPLRRQLRLTKELSLPNYIFSIWPYTCPFFFLNHDVWWMYMQLWSMSWGQINGEFDARTSLRWRGMSCTASFLMIVSSGSAQKFVEKVTAILCHLRKQLRLTKELLLPQYIFSIWHYAYPCWLCGSTLFLFVGT